MRGRLRVIAMVLAIYPLLFVFTCPETPTPTAVSHAKSLDLAGYTAVLAAVPVPPQASSEWAALSAFQNAARLSSRDPRQLTCQLLC